MVALLNARRLAFRQSFFIRPGSWIESGGIDHELIAFPFADGVAVPREVRIFGKLSSIRPDFAPDAIPFDQLDDLAGKRNELNLCRVTDQSARNTRRVRSSEWIIAEGRRNGARAEGRLVCVERGFAGRGE